MLVLIFSECVHTGQAKKWLDRGGNRTRDLWFASPMLCQLSYEVKSVRVCDISEFSLSLNHKQHTDIKNILISKELVEVSKYHTGSIPTAVKPFSARPV